MNAGFFILLGLWMYVKQKGVQRSFLATDKIILPECSIQQSTQALSTECGELSVFHHHQLGLSSLLLRSNLPNAYSQTLWLPVLLPCFTDLVITLKNVSTLCFLSRGICFAD